MAWYVVCGATGARQGDGCADGLLKMAWQILEFETKLPRVVLCLVFSGGSSYAFVWCQVIKVRVFALQLPITGDFAHAHTTHRIRGGSSRVCGPSSLGFGEGHEKEERWVPIRGHSEKESTACDECTKHVFQ